MAAPKIKYDIEAAVTGAPDAAKLAGELRNIGDVLEGPLQKSAQDAARALDALGAKQRALESFGALKRETTQLSTALSAATAVVDRLGAELPQAALSTQAFATAERTASTAVQQSQTALASKRAELANLRETVTGTARKTDEYKASVNALKEGIKSGTIEVRAQQTALRNATQATAQAQNAEAALRKEYDLAIASAVKLSGQVRNKNAVLAQSREAMNALGVSTSGLAQTERTLQTAVEQVRKAVAALAPAYQAAAAASSASTQQQAQHHRTIRDGVGEIGTQLQKIQQIAMVAVGGGFLGGMIKDLATTADEFKNLQARIKLATGEGAQFEAAFQGVSEVALRTGGTLESTGTLFTKLAKAGVEAGKSLQVAQLEALGLTETINQSIQLSGGSAESAKAAVIQLIQGLQSGVLRGEEFNSVMEQAPRLAQALSDGLGVTTGKLREMAGQGKLTAETVMIALQGQAGVVAAEFAKLPNTVGVALQNLKTQWLMYVGAADNGMLSSSNAAKMIDGLSKNLDTLITTLSTAGKIWGALKIASLAQDFGAWAMRTVTATAAVEANTAAVGVNTAGVRANSTATAAAAAAQTASVAALTAAAAAQGVSAAATAGATAQLGLFAQASRAAIAAGGVLTAGVTSTIGVMTGMTTAAGVAATALRGLAAAKTAAATAGAALVGLLGGPMGLLVLTAVFAKDIGELAAKFVLWAKGQDNVEQSAVKLSKAEEEVRKKTEEATLAREKQRLADKAAQEARQGLTARSKELIAEFDKLITAGDTAAEAIAKIGKDFNLGTQQGIIDAVGVLDKLVADGKLTAQQFKDAWTGALKGVDLGEFRVLFADTMDAMLRDAQYAAQAVENAIASGITGNALELLKAKADAAFDAVAKGAERTAQVMDATLAEAVRRTGLDMNAISGGMSKATVSALADVDRIVQGLGQLKAQGVDTALVLSTSIGKAIDTAQSQKSIDELKARIESLRAQLGDKITNGLLDQATQKALDLKDALDKALPGINSTHEAMKVLGVDAEAASSKMSKGFKEAGEAVDVLAKDFDELQKQGVNATDAIILGLNKLMGEAKNQADLDALTEKVRSLRSVLGDKVADGFLEQAKEATKKLKTAMDEATPGINSVAEALKTLGIKSEEELDGMAAKAKEAFEVIQTSGTSSTREINAAWKAMAEAAIAANDGVADASIRSQASARGFAIETDSAGKSVVKSLSEVKGEAGKVGDALDEAGEKGKDALGKIDYAAQMAGKSVEELQKIQAKGWNIAKDIGEAARIQNAAADAMTNAWRSAAVEADKYYTELYNIYKLDPEFVMQGAWKLEAALWKASDALKELDRQQQAIERSSDDAASGLAGLEDKLLELSGSEEEVAARRKARDQAEIQKKMALLELDLQRAQIRKNDEEAAQLTAELALYRKQLALLDQIAQKEKSIRDEAKRRQEEEDKARKAQDAQAAQDRKTQEAQDSRDRQAQAQKTAQGGGDNDGSSAAITPAPPASPGPTHVSHVSIQGVGNATLRFADAGSQSAAEKLLRQLAQAKGASI